MRAPIIFTLLGAAAAQTLVSCDILIAGGSLSSLAAAITAANASSATVCFTDPTDWPGGQLTASGVSAVDYGTDNGSPPNPNLPSLFTAMTDCMSDYNLGDCWVSERCFQPQDVLACWIRPTLAALPNLKVYLNTAIIASSRDAGSGRITDVTAVQRTPLAGSGWESLTSAMLQDWYDPAPSAAFSKQVFKFSGMAVVVDATEFGDVLATANVSVVQGIEAPLENSTQYITYCGQGTTIPLYMSYGMEVAPSPDPTPSGNDEGLPYLFNNFTWARVWTYRRSLAVGPNSSFDTVHQGEISNQNWGDGNDLDNMYLFLDLTPDVLSPWMGGVNITALAAAEQRALGWYHFYKNASDPAIKPYLSLNKTQTGTASGLAKMPYLRDTRRSGMGIDGFRLFYPQLANDTAPQGEATSAGGSPTAYHFNDTIGIGQYFYADIHDMIDGTCPYPSYIKSGSAVKPYYLPFRALTNADSPNLLVSGKLMAQSFFANAATRLHPEEWVTGAAAGAAAVLMHANGWSSTDMYDNVGTLQQMLLALGQPLEWTLPPHIA